MAVKGILDYIQEDKNLKKEITYAEYEEGATAPKNNDHTLDEAYDAYCKAMDEYKEKTGVN